MSNTFNADDVFIDLARAQAVHFAQSILGDVEVEELLAVADFLAPPAAILGSVEPLTVRINGDFHAGSSWATASNFERPDDVEFYDMDGDRFAASADVVEEGVVAIVITNDGQGTYLTAEQAEELETFLRQAREYAS